MCQPVAATVDHILRRAGAAAAHNAGAVSAAAAAAHKQRQHGLRIRSAFSAACEFTTVYPTVVALGSCLAVMLSSLGRPGPLLVAAGLAAAAVDGSSPQLQLSALLTSEIKVLLPETSVIRELLTMHALEQAPLYMLKQIQLRQQQQLQQGVAAVDHRQGDTSALLNCGVQSDRLLPQQQQRQCDQATRAAAVPWLLLLARLLMLRGQLLSDLLDQDLAASAHDDRTQFCMLHNTFWHIQMAEASASALEPYLQHINTSSCQLLLEHTSHTSAAAVAVTCNGRQQQEQPQYGQSAVDSRKWHQLVLNLRQALHLCKAAMKVACHYHETGFASGFAAGFAAATGAIFFFLFCLSLFL